MTELPLACTLGADALSRREGEIRRLFEDALVDSRLDGSRLALRFRADAADRVEALAAAERKCCAFLAISIGPGPVLKIEAPAGAETTLEGFAALADQALRV
jgi:hypothetical protein